MVYWEGWEWWEQRRNSNNNRLHRHQSIEWPTSHRSRVPEDQGVGVISSINKAVRITNDTHRNQRGAQQIQITTTTALTSVTRAGRVVRCERSRVPRPLRINNNSNANLERVAMLGMEMLVTQHRPRHRQRSKCCRPRMQIEIDHLVLHLSRHFYSRR